MLVTEVVCSRVHTSHCQTRQPVTADWKVSCPIQESTVASTAEEGRARQFTASELQANLHLPTVSKVLERLVLARLRPHLLSSPNFSQFQSAYRKGHSTETTLLEVLDGVFTAADDKQVTVLIGLDLSAAFDTVDHRLLLHRRLEFGVMEIPLNWLQSYLEGWTQFIKVDRHESQATEVDEGVPQGSVLGPLLFAVYCSPIADVIAHHGVQYHQYADDNQSINHFFIDI